ncbi:MAG: TetR/AcrR family transcriptional regulator [Rhodococcus sp. (in: high G+C Gram-positive bacteria)]
MENAAPSRNRRGQRSRQEILDVAARMMAARGYAGTTMSVLVKETGLPRSAFYHHFDSKAGLLSEVMARGARAFFAAMRAAHRTPPTAGSPRERLGWYLQKTGEVFVDHEDFLRLMLVLVMSNEATEATEAMQTVIDVRTEGRELMRDMIHSAFAVEGAGIAAVVADEYAHFGMAGFDGAFVSLQTKDGKPMTEFMSQLTDAIATIGEARASALRTQANTGGAQAPAV